MKSWAYELGASVALSLSGEQGHVVGRAEYTNRPDLYLVRYVAGDGRQVEDWLAEDAFTPLAL